MTERTIANAAPEHEDHLVAWLAALAIAIHILESAVPSLLPGIKPGLANVVTLIALIRYGWRVAVWVGLLRVLVGSLLIGTFLTPSFVMSFSGAAASLGILGVANLIGRRQLSAIGFGVLAAMAHVGGQVMAAYRLFIPHPAVLHLLPVLLGAGLLLGVTSGMIAQSVLTRLQRLEPCG